MLPEEDSIFHFKLYCLFVIASCNCACVFIKSKKIVKYSHCQSPTITSRSAALGCTPKWHKYSTSSSTGKLLYWMNSRFAIYPEFLPALVLTS